MLQVLLGGCGDDDHTDEWVGTWALKMWNGDNYKISGEADFKESWMKQEGGSMESWDQQVEKFEITAEFTFRNDSRWEFIEIRKLHMTPKWYEMAEKRINRGDPRGNEVLDTVANYNRDSTYISTGSYIVTDDEFIMEGDKRNTVFTGRMSGLWKRSGSKLTLFGDDKSRSLGTIVLSK